MPRLPDVSYGSIKDESDGKELPPLDDDADTDEELAETPSGVTEMLGFDPKDLGE